MGGGTSKVRALAAVLLVALAVAFAAPVAAFADDAPSFWSDPFGAIAAFFAGDAQPYAAGEETTVADTPTINDWQSYLLNADGHATTENIGRIWNDKSVSTEDITLTGGTADGITVAKGDSDFLVALSALSSMSNTTATITEPLDIVLVLDVSGSMDDGLDTYEYSPTYSVNTNGRTDYFAQTSTGSYTEIDRITGFFGGFDHWELNGETVNPKTSASDSDPDHIQFYTRQRTGSTPKITALKNAVSGFIDSMDETNAQITDTADQSRIAIVKFAGDTYRYAIGDNKGEGGNSNYNYTQVVSDFTSDADALKSDINGIDAGGATSADYGLTLAQYVLEGGTYGSGSDQGTYSGARSDAKQVVIFFTDGEPNHGSGFNTTVANDAIGASGELKDAGTLVYSIGVFEDADPSNTSTDQSNRFNAYMHGVSSNYPDATSYTSLGDRAPESDYYKAAADADGLSSIFDDIFNDVSSGTGAPTEIEDGFDAAHGGYITFTDQLDDYMKVDDFKSIVFANEKFESPQVSTSEDGTMTTYTFEGGTSTPIYPNGDLQDIIITVTHGASLAEGDLVTVKIPASLIPVRNFQVDTDNKTMSVTEAYPIRVFYGVSLKDNVAEALKTSNADGAISADDYAALKTYADAHNVDGEAAFYSNDWVAGDAGSTIASFTPSSANSFYFFTKDTPVFKDEDCTVRANVNDVKTGTTYYQQTYYESDGDGGYNEITKVNTLLPNFMEYERVGWGTDDQGVYIKAGTPHLTRTNDFYTPKADGANQTQTVTNAQNPTWVNSNTVMNSRLGNNGRLLVELPGTLSVTKSITADSGLDTAQFNDADFTFDIELKDAEGAAVSGTFPAEVRNAQGEVVSDQDFTLKFEEGKAQHSIKPNETLFIYGLTAGTTYTVTETAMPAGFTQTSPAENAPATGTIAANTVTTAAFTNNYSVTPLEYDTSAGFQVQKVLSGRDWRDGDSFDFILTAASGAPAADSSRATVTNDSTDYKASFGTITFTKPGEYVYTIEEDDDTAPIIGIDYSGATYRVTVKVVDNGDGNLKVDSVTIEQTWDDEGQELGTPAVIEGGVATFTNRYLSDTGATTIDGTKSYTDLTGGNPLVTGMFTFKMEAQGGYVTDGGSADELTIDVTNTPMPAGSENNVSTVVNNATGGFTFPTISFDGNDVGNTYVYRVSEVIPEGAVKNEDNTYTLNGMTYDATVHTLEITVTEQDDPEDLGHAHIVATPNMQPEELAFTNSYDAVPVLLSGDSAIQGTKTLNGRDMNAGEFGFRLVPTGSTLTAIDEMDVAGITKDGLTATAPAAENGQAAGFAFGGITFDKVGIYTFDMTEVTPAENDNGLTLDTHTGKVTVKVTLDADNAKLVATVDYGTYEGRAGNAFVNMYTASMDYGAAGGLNVTKVLNGRAMKAGEFSFTISGVDADGSVSADDANAKLAEADKSFSNPDNANDGAAVTMKKFNGVKFDQDDAGKTFTYEVREAAGAAGGVTYDDAVYTVAIQVIDDGDGTMHTVTTVTSSKGGEPVVIDGSNNDGGVVSTAAFTNTYKAAEVSVDGSNIIGTKTLNGRDGKDGETFGFKLEYVSGPQDGYDLIGDAQATVGELVKGAAKNFSFDGTQLTFTKAGTYTFRVTETSWNGEAIPAEATEGMIFDTHEGRVTVTVADDGTGQLKASTALVGMGFVNTYRPADATFDVSDATKFYKQLDGRDWLDSDSFTFEMSAEAGTPMPEGAEGNVARVELTSPNSVEGATVEFGFGNITYTQDDLAGELSKTFSYTVTEVQPATDAIPGMDYSGATFRIEVTVTDNLDGTLSASAKVFQTENDKGETIDPAQELGEDDNAVFFNTYSADNATVNIQATKNYTDKTGSKPLADAMFSVKIVPTGDNAADAPMPEKGTTGEGAGREYVTANSGTAFTIPTLTFDQHDSGKTFTYQVSEVIPEGATDNGDGTFTLNGMTYDATVYDISIEVGTDTSDGDAHVVATVSGIPEGGMVFSNSYDADDLVLSDDAALKVQKTLNGRDSLQGEQFGFELKLTDGDASAVSGLADGATTAYIGELKNDEAKTANFGALMFSKPGTYTFGATETMPAANGNGMTKDVHTSTVTVMVVDNNGKLELAEGSPVYDNSQATTEADKAVTNAAAFTNAYTAAGSSDGSVDLEVTKNLEGRGWMDGDSFEFTLAAGDDATQAAIESGAVVMPEDTTLTIGTDTPGYKAAFGAIEFNLAAPESTYTFTVAETEGELGGVTYDTDVRTITVKVTDNGDGTLTVENLGVTGGSDSLTFTNTYEADPATLPGSENFQGTKTIDGRNGLEDETFEFTMVKGESTDGGDWSAVTTEDGQAFDKATATATMHTDSSSASYWFSDLTFAKAGTYTFNVTETGHNGKALPEDGTNAMTYDRHTGTITVVVTDDGTGKLTATAAAGSDASSIDFVNVYAPQPVTYGAGDELLGGNKFMDDKTGGFVFADGQFAFVMRGQSAGVPMPEGLDATIDDEGRPVVTVKNTKVSDDQGAYDFGEIVFEHSDMTGATDKGNGVFEKTFRYNIFEGDSTVPGVTQDNTAYTVTFTVTEDQNTGVMTVAASAVKITSGGGENQPVGMDQLDFTNTHDATKISGFQNIFKTISGRDFQEGDEFVWDISMTAVDEDGDPMPKDQLPTVVPDVSEPGADPSAELSELTYTEAGDGFSYTATIKPVNTQTGNTYRFSTGKITYEHVGTYTYTVKEQASKVAGVTSDTAEYTVVVEITEENGALKRVATVTPEPSANGTLDFTNTYAATGSLDGAANLEVTKVLEGRDWTAGSDDVPADSFQFALAAGDEATQAAIDAGTVKLPEATTVTIDHATADHKAAFGNIEFTEEGEFTFKVTEALPEDDDAETEGIQKDGVTYDESVKTVKVSVVDNLDGTLTATVTEGANPTFTNVYDSDPAQVGTEAMFALTKQLTGREGNAWTDGDSFEFTLTGEDGAPMPADAQDGSKTVTVTKGDVTDVANGIAAIDFGDIEYTATGTYTYTVVEAHAGETIDGVTHANNTVTVTVTVTDNGVGGLVAAVAKTGESKNEAGEGASFVNAYSSTVNYGDAGGVDVTKVLHDRDMAAGQFTFTATSEDEAALDKIGGKAVEMSSAAANAGTAESVTGNPFNAITFNRSDSGKSFVYFIDEVQESGSGYTCDASVYTVTITPHDNGDGTMSITTSVVDSDGEHSMTVENATTAEPQTAVVPFDNTYAADPVVIGAEGEATIAAHKTLENDDIANYAGMFHFAVTSGDVTVAEGTNAADGTVTFGDIKYTSANLYAAAHGGSDEVGTATLDETGDADVYTFSYAVAEDAAGLPEGVSYVGGNGTVTVTVTDDRAGELSVEVAYDNAEGGLEFVNAYGAGEQAELTLTGTKSIVGIDGALPPALTDGMFGFTISGSEGAPMPNATYVENTGATVEFGPITYTMENVFGADATPGADEATGESTEAGADEAAGAETAAEGVELYTAGRTKTFTYTITEDAKTVPGVTNDATAKTVEVTVTDNGDGTLTAAVTKVSEGTAQGMDFSFVNTYSVTPIEKTPTGEGGLTVTKVWDRQGGTRGLAEGDFSFAMLDAEGNVVSEGTNDAEGNVVMSPVKYTAEGRYTYKLIEVVPDGAKPVEGGYEKDGVLYVAASYAVTADVVDNRDGTLGITWTMKAEDGTETDTAEFVNVYSVNPTTVTFGAAKSLEGRAMAAGEFEFELKDADGNVIGTAKNAADGSIVFADAIQTFGAAGEYDFTVSEALPADDDASKDGIQKDGVTYDETVHTAHVAVTDDGKGNLQITELTYDGKAELPVFHNSYVEPVKPTEPGGDLPATGDASLPLIAGAAVLGAVCVAAGFAVKRRRG